MLPGEVRKARLGVSQEQPRLVRTFSRTLQALQASPFKVLSTLPLPRHHCLGFPELPLPLISSTTKARSRLSSVCRLIQNSAIGIGDLELAIPIDPSQQDEARGLCLQCVELVGSMYSVQGSTLTSSQYRHIMFRDCHPLHTRLLVLCKRSSRNWKRTRGSLGHSGIIIQ